MEPVEPASNPNPSVRRWLLPLAMLAVLATALAFGLVALLVTIFERKQEARNPFYRVVELNDDTEDPALWGKNFPMQYDGYTRTTDMVRTRFGGSEAMPRTPTQADPRSVVSASRLDEDPRLRIMWAGYAFAVDFREDRGHAFMLEDQTFTERQRTSAQPGACLHCHASVYAAYRRAGGGDLTRGFEALNPLSYAEARTHVTGPIACIDCHDPATMMLRVTRPAFMEGIRVVKAMEGIADYQVNEMATRQEMRTFVCAQCHVEYYFKGDQKRLTYPWAKGLKADEILAYYDELGHKDWIHRETLAPVLKAQHPEFEMWSQGIHSRAGVACADCHMPYVRVGALKISDHHIRSPLLNINNACQSCHHVSENELLARVETIQSRTHRLRDLALNALMDLIARIANHAAGDDEARLASARDFQRKAQFLLDFIEAENSMGFHADQESARILAESIDYSRRGQMALLGEPDGLKRSSQAAPGSPSATPVSPAPGTR